METAVTVKPEVKDGNFENLAIAWAHSKLRDIAIIVKEKI